MAEINHCDFCYSTQVAWRYPCETFSVPLADSIGHWAACDQCHIWIEAGEWEKLGKAALFEGGIEQPHPDLLVMMQTMHREFRAHRTGPALQIERRSN